MRTHLTAGSCLAILALAILGAQQQPSPQPAPGIVALVLEVQPTGVHVLSARAVRGVIRGSTPPDLTGAPRGAADMLVEYTLKSANKSAPPLATGVFHVSFVAIREDWPGPYRPPPGEPYRAKKRVIPIAVPDLGAVSIAFATVTPAEGVPPDHWVRTPIGEVSIPAVQR